MITSIKIQDNEIELKNLNPGDEFSEYLSWMNNDFITQYLEVRFEKPKNIESLKKFVELTNESENSILFGIFLKKNNIHIGNIKLDINLFHNRGEIGLLIGNRSYWGKGFASKAINLISDYAFNNIKLKKLTAGCYENNVGSIKAFLNAGFDIEANLKSHWSFKNERQRGVLLAKFNLEKKY